MKDIESQDIRKVILNFLDERLINNAKYKSAQTELEKAKQSQNQSVINDCEKQIAELKARFEFENWMNDALTKRVFWIDICTHLSKGIHSSSNGNNVNFQSDNLNDECAYVSSATPASLPIDCSGNAAGLDIFSLLNQPINERFTLLDLIIHDHPKVQSALSDDQQQAKIYLNNLKQLVMNNVEKPKSSELNKQIYWPNHPESYLSAKTDDYRIITPLYPSSLMHLVYQKVQSRFSDENKNAIDLKNKKSSNLMPYFTFNDLAIVKLGGSNPQGVSQLISRQGGSSFLLPAIPPTFNQGRFPSLSTQMKTIFDKRLRYYCGYGFQLLFDAIKNPKNTIQERDKRKHGLDIIFMLIIKYAKNIQTTMPAGWSLGYNLKMSEKYWLDPKRADLEDEDDFKKEYQKGDWLKDIEKNVAFWINLNLKEKSSTSANQFSDTEFREWQQTFRSAANASKRKQQGVF